MRNRPPAAAGFTLVELSIVLVIIGLIVSGILVGRELIQAARLRQQITQIEQYKVAYTTFKLKYNAVPGDIRGAQAAAFGFIARSGAPGHGDGDEVIENCLELYNGNQGCEQVLFWADLSSAALIPESLTAATDSDPVYATDEESLLYWPALKIRPIYRWIVAPRASTREPWILTRQLPVGLVQLGFTTIEAFNLDTKLDNGRPEDGHVRAHSTGGAPLAASEGTYFGTPSASCVTASATYNVTYAGTIQAPCQMNFRLN